MSEKVRTRCHEPITGEACVGQVIRLCAVCGEPGWMDPPGEPQLTLPPAPDNAGAVLHRCGGCGQREWVMPDPDASMIPQELHRSVVARLTEERDAVRRSVESRNDQWFTTCKALAEAEQRIVELVREKRALQDRERALAEQVDGVASTLCLQQNQGMDPEVPEDLALGLRVAYALREARANARAKAITEAIRVIEENFAHGDRVSAEAATAARWIVEWLKGLKG